MPPIQHSPHKRTHHCHDQRERLSRKLVVLQIDAEICQRYIGHDTSGMITDRSSHLRTDVTVVIIYREPNNINDAVIAVPTVYK